MSKSYDDAHLFCQALLAAIKGTGSITIKRYYLVYGGEVLDKVLTIPFSSADITSSIDESELLREHPNLYRHHEFLEVKAKLANKEIKRTLGNAYVTESDHSQCWCSCKVEFHDSGRLLENPYFQGKKVKGIKKLVSSSPVVKILFTIDDSRILARMSSSPRYDKITGKQTGAPPLSRSGSQAYAGGSPHAHSLIQTKQRASSLGNISPRDDDLQRALQLSKQEAKEKTRMEKEMMVKKKDSERLRLQQQAQEQAERKLIEDALKASERSFQEEQQRRNVESQPNHVNHQEFLSVRPDHNALGNLSEQSTVIAAFLAPEINCSPRVTEDTVSSSQPSFSYSFPSFNGSLSSISAVSSPVTSDNSRNEMMPHSQSAAGSIEQAPYDVLSARVEAPYENPGSSPPVSPYEMDPAQISYSAVSCPYEQDYDSSSTIQTSFLPVQDSSSSLAAPYDSAASSVVSSNSRLAPYEPGFSSSSSSLPIQENSMDSNQQMLFASFNLHQVQAPSAVPSQLAGNRNWPPPSSPNPYPMANEIPSVLDPQVKVQATSVQSPVASPNRAHSHVPYTSNQSAPSSPAPKVDKEKICVICEINPREMLMYPCGHLCCCESCASVLKEAAGGTLQCPMCGKYVKDAVKVYR